MEISSAMLYNSDVNHLFIMREHKDDQTFYSINSTGG